MLCLGDLLPIVDRRVLIDALDVDIDVVATATASRV